MKSELAVHGPIECGI